MSEQSKTNLFNLPLAGMRDFFASIGEQPFRATQIMKWLYHHQVLDFQEMTNISKSLRQRLVDVATTELPQLLTEQRSTDGTCKWLVKLADGNSIETVFIPESTRGTLCVSSQVGCALNCSFCSTGKQGFNRDLSTSEIIGQVWLANQRLQQLTGQENKIITNVVMMGMGEPLKNTTNVINAMNIMLADEGYGLSKYRVTLSTSGVVPEMWRLREQSPVALAVSLHAANNELRNQLVPVNRKYPLEELIPACRQYFKHEPRRKVVFEYVMLDQINDSKQDAKQLIRLLEGVPCKINLIPFNPFPETEYVCSPMSRMVEFQQRLKGAGFVVTIRTTRGEDIDGACGQLVGDVQQRVPAYLLRQQLTANG